MSPTDRQRGYWNLEPDPFKIFFFFFFSKKTYIDIHSWDQVLRNFFEIKNLIDRRPANFISSLPFFPPPPPPPPTPLPHSV